MSFWDKLRGRKPSIPSTPEPEVPWPFATIWFANCSIGRTAEPLGGVVTLVCRDAKTRDELIQFVVRYIEKALPPDEVKFKRTSPEGNTAWMTVQFRGITCNHATASALYHEALEAAARKFHDRLVSPTDDQS